VAGSKSEVTEDLLDGAVNARKAPPARYRSLWSAVVAHPQQVAGDDADLVAGLSQSIDHGLLRALLRRAVGDSCLMSSPIR